KLNAPGSVSKFNDAGDTSMGFTSVVSKALADDSGSGGTSGCRGSEGSWLGSFGTLAAAGGSAPGGGTSSFFSSIQRHWNTRKFKIRGSKGVGSPPFST